MDGSTHTQPTMWFAVPPSTTHTTITISHHSWVWKKMECLSLWLWVWFVIRERTDGTWCSRDFHSFLFATFGKCCCRLLFVVVVVCCPRWLILLLLPHWLRSDYRIHITSLTSAPAPAPAPAQVSVPARNTYCTVWWVVAWFIHSVVVESTRTFGREEQNTNVVVCCCCLLLLFAVVTVRRGKYCTVGWCWCCCCFTIHTHTHTHTHTPTEATVSFLHMSKQYIPCTYHVANIPPYFFFSTFNVQNSSRCMSFSW